VTQARIGVCPLGDERHVALSFPGTACRLVVALQRLDANVLAGWVASGDEAREQVRREREPRVLTCRASEV
jgi:hypothetical protein